MRDYFAWAPLWSGQLPLSLHLFESLLSLFGSSKRHAHTTQTPASRVSSHLVSECWMWAPFITWTQAISSKSKSGALLPIGCQMTAVWWLVFRAGGSGKSHLLKQKFFGLISFLFLDVSVMDGSSLHCWFFFLLVGRTTGFQILTFLHLSLVARQPSAPTSSSQPYYRYGGWSRGFASRCVCLY